VLLAPHFAIAPLARVCWFSRNSNRDWEHYGSSIVFIVRLLKSIGAPVTPREFNRETTAALNNTGATSEMKGGPGSEVDPVR
jgi:hypothetical protein